MKKVASLLLVVVFIFSFMVAPVFAEKATKEMDVNATVDIGKNTKDLLEQGGEKVMKLIESLAKSLGMTVKEIFPYYVKQAAVKGNLKITFFSIAEAILFVLAVVLALMCLYLMKRDKDDYAGVAGVAAVIMLALFVIGIIGGIFFVPDWVAMTKNPEYYAIQNIVQDSKDLIRVASEMKK
jgi:hypothetical protein